MMASFLTRSWTTNLVACALVVGLSAALGAQEAAPAGQPAPHASSPAPQAPSLTPQASENYTIGAQDVLAITDFDETSLTGQYTVQNDGTLTFPYIGAIKAAGRTVQQFEAALKTQLVDQGYFKKPQVNVQVAQYRSQHVYVMGEVRAAGSYPLTGGMTLIEAIADAGASTPDASGDVVIVRPKDGHAEGPEGLPGTKGAANDADVLHVDLAAIQNGALDKNLQLRDGDTVFVGRAQSVYVYGEVKSPNAYPLPRNTSVMQAITLAGGPTPDAAMNRVTIVRFVNGKSKEIKVSQDDLQTMVVQPGDTIKIPTRWF